MRDESKHNSGESDHKDYVVIYPSKTDDEILQEQAARIAANAIAKAKQSAERAKP